VLDAVQDIATGTKWALISSTGASNAAGGLRKFPFGTKPHAAAASAFSSGAHGLTDANLHQVPANHGFSGKALACRQAIVSRLVRGRKVNFTAIVRGQ
jgi:hypothetical protein